jgi:tRNA pseudouridine-54 N-methylase
MSSVKRHNHRVHPCTTHKKNELLNFLIANNENQNILILTSHDPKTIEIASESENIMIMSDTQLQSDNEITCNLLISYDLPETPEAYLARLSRADTKALILLNEDERALLHPIERALGRTLIQEQLEGFEAKFAMEPEAKEKVYRNDYTNDRKDFKKDKRNSDKKFGSKDHTKKSGNRAPTSKAPVRKISGKVFKAAKESK